jgi:hypothetical protein
MRGGRDVLFYNYSLATNLGSSVWNLRYLCDRKSKTCSSLQGTDVLIDSPDHSSEMMGH